MAVHSHVRLTARVARGPAVAVTPRRTRGVPPRAARDGLEPDLGLNPVLSVVNSATMYIASNDTLNGLKSSFWGLFAGSYDEAAVAAELDAIIASAPVVVFTWSFSPFSVKARSLLDTLGARYTAVELDKTPGGMALKKELGKRTGRSSVPSVFIKGSHVGGCFDGPGLVPLYKSGELQKMLKQARAV